MAGLTSVISERWRFRITVAVLSILFYGFSSAGSILEKATLQAYPYPLTVALSSLVFIVLYTEPLLWVWAWRRNTSFPLRWHPMLIPQSIGKALYAGMDFLSIHFLTVSYSNTVKASLPLFAIVLSRLLLRERQHIVVYLTLIPIVAGIALASATEFQFDAAGLATALAATFVACLMNIVSKKTLSDTGMHSCRLMAFTVEMAIPLFVPFWLYFEAWHLGKRLLTEGWWPGAPDLRFLGMISATGFFYFAQHITVYQLIDKMSALSYSITNTAKRFVTIATSLLILQNPVSALNMVGMVIAILGILLYNVVLTRFKTSMGTKKLIKKTTSSRQQDCGVSIESAETESTSSVDEQQCDCKKDEVLVNHMSGVVVAVPGMIHPIDKTCVCAVGSSVDATYDNEVTVTSMIVGQAAAKLEARLQVLDETAEQPAEPVREIRLEKRTVDKSSSSPPPSSSPSSSLSTSENISQQTSSEPSSS